MIYPVDYMGLKPPPDGCFEVDAWGRRRGGCRLGGCHVYRWTPLAVPVALRSRLAKGLDAELL